MAKKMAGISSQNIHLTTLHWHYVINYPGLYTLQYLYTHFLKLHMRGYIKNNNVYIFIDVNESIVIDGNLNEFAWESVAWTNR